MMLRISVYRLADVHIGSLALCVCLPFRYCRRNILLGVLAPLALYARLIFDRLPFQEIHELSSRVAKLRYAAKKFEESKKALDGLGPDAEGKEVRE